MDNFQFPNPQTANEDGIVAIGGNLEVTTLLNAYSQGIFPWPHDGLPLLWFCPWERGILNFNEFHISKSLKKFSRKTTHWHFTLNQAFLEVITNCAHSPRKEGSGTWINHDIIKSYNKLHKAGYAHSFEAWEENSLIGGVYGVFVKNVFSAESMFFKKDNASKWVFVKMVDYLNNLGLQWIDIQMVTPISARFGARLISQQEFLNKMSKSQKLKSLSIKAIE